MAQNDLDWITPLLGFVGLLAGSLFLTGQKDNNLPPPPMNQKPSGCGCQANNRNNR